MPDPRIQTRVDGDVVEAVEDYAEREQTNKSAAVRQFVVAGMDEMDELPEGSERPKATDTVSNDYPYREQVVLGKQLMAAFATITMLSAALAWVFSLTVLADMVVSSFLVFAGSMVYAYWSLARALGETMNRRGTLGKVGTFLRATVADAEDLGETATDGGAD
mgnify:CR=1 FL=1